ncbi:glycosyltransferase [Roseateles oligotrophus]|uniref:Glycosyltransferase n=1 Tax=Roseateles oligotrophus TaxID=1769250 RepID=A0ABT2YFP8_9BURK|nr:glycosyltransferase [Roseateles oligotrophus]MCV2368869.1 glycosyltransferase [Roseateles oligotrophus]
MHNPRPPSTRGVADEELGAIAYLVSRYPAVSHTFILREVMGLRALGMRVEVASINAPDRDRADMSPDEHEEASHTYGIKQHGLPGALLALLKMLLTRPLALARTVYGALGMGQGFKRLYALAYAVEAAMVVRWMERRQLKHLHVHFGNAAATVGMLVKTLSGAGLSITIHGPDEFDDVPGQLLRQKVHSADQVVCISQFARSQLMRLTPPTQWPKLQLCRLGVDLARFRPRLEERAPGPLRLLCIGRLTPAKGQVLLLQACAELRQRRLDFALTLVGDGPDMTRLKDSVKTLGLSSVVSFTGSLNQQQVSGELGRADAFVLPSLAEGIPVVLMEAMASGLPCVSCPVMGIPELLEHERSGLLAAPGDVAALTRQLQRLIEDAGLRQRLATEGRLRVERGFQLRKNIGALAEIFSTLPDVGVGVGVGVGASLKAGGAVCTQGAI